MNDCYFDKRDWRCCRKEVSSPASQVSFVPISIFLSMPNAD